MARLNHEILVKKSFAHSGGRVSFMQNHMRAIIIAAGRGRRLMPTTADSPKCFAAVQNRRILDWDLEALAANGIKDICFIGGYQIDKVRAAYPHFTFRHNDNWE